MPVKIRLARHGRKRRAFYHIVVADSRAPRDGRYIERIGSYNPNTNPATIDLNFDKALTWLGNGAQPTDTARAILSYEGVMMKKHLLDGVKKGAFDEATAEEKFQAWKQEKEAKINAKKDGLSKAADEAKAARLEAEAKISADRAEAIAKKAAEAEAAAKAEEAGDDAEAANEEGAEETEA
ncbi:30S ribosomal protein S16 [Marinifilum sp. D714]|uniref:30S ribosomal protein S16 n=1 Tax=Marinifilum sp. D714 TaxID=2937523 RepID=UPI0027BFCACC|nr:30S ribosomal protein S16 [Marinifilum sp. D714]MDQ2180331.1 30S ribosomal protein S16 [Marinifilum sp. D714]